MSRPRDVQLSYRNDLRANDEAMRERVMRGFEDLLAALDACEPLVHVLDEAGKSHDADCPGCRARELLGLPKLEEK